MRTTIRAARSDDADFLAWAMLTASRSHVPRGVWEYLFDFSEDTTRRLLAAIVVSERPHWCHWSVFHVAEIDGARAAALCAFDPRTQGMHVLKPIVQEAAIGCGIGPADVPGIEARGAVLDAAVPDYADGAWVVENVATVPTFRRRGLIDTLMRHVLGIGRSRGFPRAQISVFIDNTPALRAYEKNGFVIESEKRSAALQAALGFPGLRRLLQTL
jgi:ribosomal protein S18 acetylase RimI-like enzyme